MLRKHRIKIFKGVWGRISKLPLQVIPSLKVNMTSTRLNKNILGIKK
jgi:hypothetical protein